MSRDERVFLMGEDVGRYGGCYAVSKGLLDEFGPERIRDTPLSESGFVGAGIGAALGGMRPIVEVMTVNFSLLALDQIVNNAATLRHMSGGQFGVPLVIRMATGAGRQLAAQHSHSLEGWYAHIPGIKVLAPATVEDARGMLWTALEDPDPVLIFEHVDALQHGRASWPPTPAPVDIDTRGGPPAGQRRLADHLRRLAVQDAGRGRAAGRARASRPRSIDLRVAAAARRRDDPRPRSRKTHRAVIVDEGWRTGSLVGRDLARGSWSRPSTTRRAGRRGCAAPRCRSPTRSTSRRRRCRSRRRSSPPPRDARPLAGRR